MLMPANNSSPVIHYWAGKYPGRIGWLIGPSAMEKTKRRNWIPYALDNDAYTAWAQTKEWDVGAWRELLVWARMSGQDPLWVLVPDVVADPTGTKRKWMTYCEEAGSFGWPLAFAVQDGMRPDDVPVGADLIFIGGTTTWKWRSLPMWLSHFKRVHVGRVNELRRLWTCEDLGVESVDGTGWFRDTEEGRRVAHIEMWLASERSETMELKL